ncbi:hypothetical protein [Nocardia sp. NPDC004260]
MYLLEVRSGDRVDEFRDPSRFCNDEHNNLCVFDGEERLAGLYAAESWQAAVMREVE